MHSAFTILEHISLNLDQFKAILCSDLKALERVLCAKSGTRRSTEIYLL